MKLWKGTAIILPGFILLAVILFFLKKNNTRSIPPETIETVAQPTDPPSPLSDLGSRPDWSSLDPLQKTITRKTFISRLERVYTKYQSWKKWLNIKDDHVVISTSSTPYRFFFATQERILPPLSSLSDLHIAIDPGHIGGAFAEMEERHLQYGDHTPIREGNMTLATAQILAPLLRSHGARVTLVRDKNEPVTIAKPTDFQSERLFYRTSEIRARAQLVNQHLKPDLVLCLHFNASGSPVPIPGQHLHILINGAYHESELKHEDERFQMLHRLLSRASELEIPLASSIIESFKKQTKLPPYLYRPDHPFSVNIAENDYLWARNLLANRLYQCPVIFLEPYVMNSTEFVARFKKNPDLIYQEYAQAVLDGVLSHFSVEQ